MINPPLISDPELDQLILDGFPTPLAVAYQKILQAETWNDRYYRALALFDYGVRSLALVYARQYLQSDSPKGMNHPGLNQALSKFHQPTLGQWLDILFNAMEAYKDQRDLHPFPQFYDRYSHQEHGTAFRRACQEIVQIRNNTFHRFAPENEQEWQETFEKIFSRLKVVLKLFSFIQEYTLIDITELTPRGAIGIQYKGIRPRPITLPADSVSLQTDHLYLWAQAKQDNRYYDLHPLIISWPPDSKSLDAALYESLTKVRIDYLATLIRQTVTSTDQLLLSQLSSSLDAIQQRRRVARHTVQQLTWDLLRQIVLDITQVETEAVRAKFDPKVYLQRRTAKSAVDEFLASDSTALILLGKSGVGKSNFLLSLLDAYATGDDVAVLMLDAARLPAQDPLDFTLTKMIRQVADIPEDLMSALEKNLWGELNKITSITNKQLILIFDAINENDKARELLVQVDRLIGGVQRHWLKIIISTRPQAWKIIQHGLHLAEHRYFRLIQRAELGIDLEGFTLTEHGAELKDFTSDELPEVYAKYAEVWNLQTKYVDLPIELKRRLRDPLTLKLIAEIYKNQAVPAQIDASELYLRYAESLIEANRLSRGDVIFLEQELMPLMISQDHYANEITAEQVAETILPGGRPLRDLIHDTSLLESGLRINAPFTRLADAEILIKQGSPSDFTIRYKYERFYDYYAGKTLVQVAKKASLEPVHYYSNLIDSLNKHPYLWGAIQQALVQEAKAERISLLTSLAENEKQIVRDILFNTIVDLKKSRAEVAHQIVQVMFDKRTLNLEKLAVQVSGAIGETKILEEAGNSKLLAIRTLAVQSTYYLWQFEPELGWKVLKNWSMIAIGRFGLPNTHLLESILSVTMLIITDQRNTKSSDKIDFQNPEILTPLQEIWKGIIDKLLFINREGNITKVTRIVWSSLTLSALIKFGLGVTTGASIITTRQRGSVIPLIKAYFRKPISDRQILADLMVEFRGEQSGIKPLEDLLYKAFKDNEPIPIILGLSLITMRCNKNDVHRDIATISRLFTRLFDPANPSMAVAQLVFTTAGVFQKSNGKIQSETWNLYTDMQRKYLDAGGLYYLPNQPKYEAGYIDAYTLIAVQKLGQTAPTLFSEYILRALEGKPAPSLAGLLGEADGLAIVGKQPQLALAVMQPLITHQDQVTLEIFSKVLARIRLYYPDLLDNYLWENNAPPELIMKVQTTVVTENLWADFLISRVGSFMSEILFIPTFRDVFLSAFQNAKTARSLEDWLISTVKLVINFIYGKAIL